MTFVYQTEHGSDGNCFAACVATIVGCPLQEVPDLRGNDNWTHDLTDWLITRRWNASFIQGDNRSVNKQINSPLGYAILHHRVHTGFVHTAVVKDGQLIHDPAGRVFCHPEATVLLWTVLTKAYST
jgi:hypothetical protein